MTARPQSVVLADLLALSPPGWALPRDPDGMWSAFLSPDAAVLADVEAAAEALPGEVDPRTAVHLLGDWQRLLGADPYGRDAASLNLTGAAQAQLAWQRLTAGGGMAVADYVALALQSGVTITVKERWQTQAGDMQCGWQLCSDRWTAECGLFQAGQGLDRAPQQFTWLVSLPASLLTHPQAGSMQSGDTLGQTEPTAAVVAAAIRGEAPAHTRPDFLFT